MFESLKSTDFTLFLALLPAFVKRDFFHQHVFCFWWFKWLQMSFDEKYLVHNALCSPRFIWSKLFVWFLIINIQILFLSLRVFSDPYARVVFGTQSQVTEILTTTICPTWDQTLIFENVQIYGSIDKVARYPPEVIIELFDKDPVVSQSLTYGEASVFLPSPVRYTKGRLIVG